MSFALWGNSESSVATKKELNLLFFTARRKKIVHHLHHRRLGVTTFSRLRLKKSTRRRNVKVSIKTQRKERKNGRKWKWERECFIAALAQKKKMERRRISQLEKKTWNKTVIHFPLSVSLFSYSRARFTSAMRRQMHHQTRRFLRPQSTAKKYKTSAFFHPRRPNIPSQSDPKYRQVDLTKYWARCNFVSSHLSASQIGV